MRPIIVAILIAGCTPVVPDHIPDAFDGARVSCETTDVQAEMFPLAAPVKGCLLTRQEAPDCLSALLAENTVDGVACTVRELGRRSNRAVLVGDADDDARTMDETARWWLTSRKVGFR